MRVRAIVVVLLLLAAACAGRAKPPAQVGSTSAPAKPVVCPLTGQERPPGFPVERPALAVKIENSAPARPQAGLEAADIVYEELTEGGITRFLALYHCSDESDVRLGPVRSARLVDPDILVEYQPVLFGYSGGNETVVSKVRSTGGVVDLAHGSHGAAYERVRGRRAPHNLFTSTDKLRALSDAKGPPGTGLVFRPAAAAPPPSPGPAASPGAPGPEPPAPPPPGASASFSFAGGETVRYTYDGASGAYLRFHGQTPHKVETGSQIGAVNVVVVKVKVRPGGIRDAAGNVSPEITLVGEGEAVVLSGGVAATGRWRRASLSDHMQLADAAGAPIQLSPGNTWIHLVPEDRPVEVQ